MCYILQKNHTLQNISKTTRICGHLQNKPYKTTSRFLQNLTTRGEHHTERKQNQNRKQIGEKKFCSLRATILLKILFAFPDHLLLSPSSPQLQPRHHNIDNFPWHHIIVNIFFMKQVMPKPPITQTLPYFFLVNCLKSIPTSITKNL